MWYVVNRHDPPVMITPGFEPRKDPHRQWQKSWCTNVDCLPEHHILHLYGMGTRSRKNKTKHCFELHTQSSNKKKERKQSVTL